jgi:hypothetical protein
VFHALFARRLDRAVEIGFERTETGAWVNWTQLTNQSWLSSTEIAVVHIAHGCAIAERHGGLGPGLRQVVIQTVTAVSGSTARD